VADIEERVNTALEKCFTMKARAAQRAATRATKAAPAKAVARVTAAPPVTAPRRQARAS
jgi:hypothetical protein